MMPPAVVLSQPCAPDFQDAEDRGALDAPLIDEASGLAVSRETPGVLWTHNDSGDLPRVYAITTTGDALGVYQIEGTNAEDFEDIAVGSDPATGTPWLLVGDIGDNYLEFDVHRIHRLVEPVPPASGGTQPIVAETIVVAYPDGRHDAEALLVDPWTGDLHVVTKHETDGALYRAAYPQSLTGTITLERLLDVDVGRVTAGDISPDGSEILLKTGDTVYHWCRETGESVASALSGEPSVLPYDEEPQGEAIAWGPSGDDYYTLSEQVGPAPHVFRYLRQGVVGVASPPADRRLHAWAATPAGGVIAIHVDPPGTPTDVDVHDVAGRRVASWHLKSGRAGSVTLRWRARGCEAGAYWVRVVSGSARRTFPVTLLR